MPSADLTFRSFARLTVRFTAVLRGAKAMSGKNNLVDNLSRNLDRARGKRDALASDVTTLTAQIAEIEARLIEEKTRRERGRVLGEIEAIKKRIQQTASAFAPVIGELCEATEMAAAVVPEAREPNSFLFIGCDRSRYRNRFLIARTGPTRGCGASRPRCTRSPVFSQ
jgi:outer membrane murein-binding lipoprotein Lpp